MSKPAWIDEVAPTFHGPAARVWKVTAPIPQGEPRADMHLGAYLIYAPAAHPFWAWHVMAGIALRDAPGLPPAHRHYPEAEYELLVLALSPDHSPADPRTAMVGEYKAMTPPDAVAQWHGTDDEQARELIETCAKAVADGVLIPDSDFAQSWKATVTATAEHYQPGGHA